MKGQVVIVDGSGAVAAIVDRLRCAFPDLEVWDQERYEKAWDDRDDMEDLQELLGKDRLVVSTASNALKDDPRDLQRRFFSNNPSVIICGDPAQTIDPVKRRALLSELGQKYPSQWVFGVARNNAGGAFKAVNGESTFFPIRAQPYSFPKPEYPDRLDECLRIFSGYLYKTLIHGPLPRQHYVRVGDYTLENDQVRSHSDVTDVSKSWIISSSTAFRPGTREIFESGSAHEWIIVSLEGNGRFCEEVLEIVDQVILTPEWPYPDTPDYPDSSSAISSALLSAKPLIINGPPEDGTYVNWLLRESLARLHVPVFEHEVPNFADIRGADSPPDPLPPIDGAQEITDYLIANVQALNQEAKRQDVLRALEAVKDGFEHLAPGDLEELKPLINEAERRGIGGNNPPPEAWIEENLSGGMPPINVYGGNVTFNLNIIGAVAGKDAPTEEDREVAENSTEQLGTVADAIAEDTTTTVRAELRRHIAALLRNLVDAVKVWLKSLWENPRDPPDLSGLA